MAVVAGASNDEIMLRKLSPLEGARWGGDRLQHGPASKEQRINTIQAREATMFRNQKMQRSVAAFVLTTFISLSLYPLTAAAQVKETLEQAGVLPPPKDEGIIDSAKSYIAALAGNGANTKAQSADERFAQLLNDIHEDLKAAVPQAALSKVAKQALKSNLPNGDLAAKTKNIRAKRKELKQLYADIEQSFKDTEQRLKNFKLPQEILERHNDAVAQYQSRKAEFEKLMEQLEQTDDSGNGAERQLALEALGSFMAKHPNAKPHQYTDPNKLPFRTPDGKVRKPFETKEEYQASLFPPKYEKVMLASLSLDGVKLAQATLPQTPAAPDLAETDDVQITQPVKDLAAQLNKDPVKIYNWVRNNVAFIPSYGSIQGSDMTLQNKHGNAFDTASLLIALYRAAGIPARYVYGTIEVPVDKVMNWVGGVTKPEAAQSLLGQGGIPNVALVSGGTVKAIRMEHVWVEAYVDYTPSRGAINKSPNTWVPMDASFKQYQFTGGMNIKSNLQLNAQSLFDQMKQGATINEAEGWVQNLNQGNLAAQAVAYQDQAKNYIKTQNPNATVGDILGSQKIVGDSRPILMGSLAYKVVSIGNKFQSLPDNLRWKFKTNLYQSDWLGDSSTPIIELNLNTAKLAGKKITVSFVPATQADHDLINSYLPKPHTDGTPVQPSELPKSLPGYLLNMKAELRLDGQLVAQTAQSFTMGSQLRQSNQYFNPSSSSWSGGDDNDVTVGEYNAIGLDLQGISPSQNVALKVKMQATKAKLDQAQLDYRNDPSNSAVPSALSNLSRDDFAGDILYANILAYFSTVDGNDKLVAGQSGVVYYRMPSYGRVVTDASPQLWFGIVRSVAFPGVVFDVDSLFYQTEAKDAEKGKRVSFTQQAGAADSAFEHLIPENFFRNPDLAANDPAQPKGVSAIKLISLAAQQGQRLYTFNTGNQSIHSLMLGQLNLSSDVKQEITNALAVGKTVITHQNSLVVDGWTGAGYIIQDPDTGAGAYKIAGGANGGLIKVLMATVLSAFLIFEAGVLLFSGAWIIGGLVLAWEIYAFYDFIEKLDKVTTDQQLNSLTAATVITAMVGLIPALELGGIIAAALQYAFLILFGIFKMGIL